MFDGEVKISQSTSILRHVARKFSMVCELISAHVSSDSGVCRKEGSTEVMKAKADEVLQVGMDYSSRLTTAAYGDYE
eukprot:10137941-Ditylum_brightwellii.AAC.1